MPKWQRIGWRRPSHSLNGPTTLTRRAFGAQTEKATPVDAVERRLVRAEPAVELEMIALGDEVEVHRAEEWREAVGVFDLLASSTRRR